MRGALALAAGAGLLAGCGPSALPDLRIVSIDPDHMDANESIPVTVTVDAVYPLFVDYGASSASGSFGVSIGVGTVELNTEQFSPDGRYTGRLPSRLAPGIHNVTFSLPPREAVLPNAFTVLPGTWPMGYRVELNPMSGAPQRGVPFLVDLTALGPGGSTSTRFAGTVDYIIEGAWS
ncbi:MAG TPA: hypothetical protein VFB81_05285, partial [Myxococcales bacterium]|nr:hypothetical protein [Myxococcales bacterium]